ncbi:collagen alpha-3(VI) chain isoform X3 [Bombina bombina]|uniref:collagen alpha-3(VI) chain isoform X3 n=1 Tax=Bombina bombina TaxID=8345 RepID=UPI00235B1E03|nr:collagen alpha-3(VI) chain isoform X3 [Bombina bombina]
MKRRGFLLLVAAFCQLLSGMPSADAQEDSADLVFLIDGSNNVGRSNFPAIREFLVNFVRRLEVGSNRMLIGVVQYSDDVKTEFTLDEFSSKDQVIQALRNLRFIGGEQANLGVAIDYVVENLFTIASGSRKEEGVPQSLVIITAGSSSDDTREASNALKLNSVITFGIGVERADISELQQIASDDSFVFNAPQFQALGGVEREVLPYIAGVAQRTIVLQPPTTVTEVIEVNMRDIVFLIDGSSDMGASNFIPIRDFIIRLLGKLEVGPDLIRVAVVQYADTAKVEFNLNTYPSKKEMTNQLKKMKIMTGASLNTGAALNFVRNNVFTASAGSRAREGVPQLLVLITGGRSRDDVTQPALELKRMGILGFTIGAKNADLAELQEISFLPETIFQPQDFTSGSLLRLINAMIPSLKTMTGRTVIEETTQVNQRDIVFLLDGSVNVGNANFPFVRDFIIDLINNLDISSEGTRIGLVQFSDTPRTELPLNMFLSKSELQNRLGQMRVKGGSVLNTGSALQFVIKNHFTSSAGSRIEEGIPQLLVVLLAGKSSDNIDVATRELINSGVLTFCVGVKNADKEELETIAFNPAMVYEMDDFSALSGLSQQIIDPLNTYVRGERTEVTVTVDESAKKDIVFLVDGSDDNRAGFASLRTFIQRVVESLDVGQDRVRIAVIQYSDSIRPAFLLNTHSDRQAVLNAINRLNPIGGSPLNTGAALYYVTRNVFSGTAGSRAAEGVPQFLILLTGGKSSDDVRRPATELKSNGVVPFAIGVNRADQTELQQIAFIPDFVLYVPQVTQLENAYQSFSQRVGQLTRQQITTLLETVPTVTESKKDILFLIDASSNVAGRFPLVRDFVAAIIENLNVGEDATRVSVGQVGENVKVEFKFDSFPTKQEVISAVKKMRFKPEKNFKIGNALEYARRNLFTPDSGSRITEGVPQYLVLLSAGKSTDSVDQPAANLKKAGIVTFAIKSRNADSEELEKIVLAPQFVVSVDSLQELAGIQAQFVNLLKTISVVTTPETYDATARKDIVFLLDGSEDARSNFPALRSFIQRIVENLDVGQDKIRVAVVQYSDSCRPTFLLNAYSDRQSAIGSIQRMTPIGGSPLNTGAALDYVTRSVFTSEAGSRGLEGVPQFLILLTTGKSRDDVRRPATALKKNKVIPFAIGANKADMTELQTISFIPDFAFSVPDVSQLSNIYQTITTRVAQLKQGDVEILIQTIPSVEYTGDKRDVVFLVDGSRGTGPEFNNIREFIGRIVDRLDVSSDNTRVGVVQYSEDPKVEFLLNAHSTKEEVQSAVRRMRPKGGASANTGNALEYVSKNIFTRPSGSRIEEQVPQFLIIASSGPSADDVAEGSKQVKESAVFPFLIGKNVDTEEAKKITLAQEYIYPVSSFRDLSSVEQNLLTPITSLSMSEITRIIEQSGIKEDFDSERKDVVFLIDGSTATGADGLANIRDFILALVQNFNIGPNKVRVGLVQFSDDAISEFYLKTNLNKPALIQNIRRLRLRGGSSLNIGKALEYVAKNQFVKSAGSRIEEGVPQHLVLLVGGKSQDDVRRSARLLGDAKVKSMAVASGNAVKSEIESIVSDPRFLFTIREFRELPRIQNVLFESFKGPVEPTAAPPDVTVVSGRKEADIVFLVDGSINLGRDSFKEVLQFVSGIADAVVDEEDSIQIALAQYNSDVTDEFFLKDYKDREVITEAVTKVEYKGGRVASTGAAIKHLQEKHFVKSAGSRIDSGVPQIAFVITGGKSVDDGKTAALSLASKGVKVFAIGVGSMAIEEVNKLASDSAAAFRVPNVQELSELNEQILITLDTAFTTKQATLCPGVTAVTKDCKLEVILGFDVSGQNIFTAQRELESLLRRLLEHLSNMKSISCSGSQQPSVKVAILAQGSTGPVEVFDFSEYRPELLEKLTSVATKGPFVLTARTLQTYLNKFRTSAEDDSLKVIIHMTDGPDEGMAELQAASAVLQNAGVRALLFVGLENVPRFDQVMQLEFGRGFTYTIPLTANQADVGFNIIDELDKIAEKGCCGVSCKCNGQRGDVGPPGPSGQKGTPGLKGHQGFPGEEGGPGERGPQGVNGTQGFQGCPGQRGTKGSRGFSGDKGEVGEIGLDGIDGEEGNRGTPGSAGERGSAGPRGEKGLKGQRGERGDSGLRGDPGEPGTDATQRGARGNKGEAGSVGEPGGDGAAGPPGGPGKQGPVGRRGPPGIKGNKGAAGPPGGVGEQGLRGSQGPPGQIGAPGTRGEQGSPGPRGPGGTPGSAGDRGRAGPLGRKGEPGDRGAKGSDGPTGPRGETGEDGRDGAGNPGLKGRKGETGFPGYPGSKGDPGDKGSEGDLGPKGNRGRRGNAGDPGTVGGRGDPGYPGAAGLKGNRGGGRDQCALVQNIRNKCPCCYGAKECPVFPTDLAFVVDTSSDVNRNAFNNMKEAVLRVVNELAITESNCPRGARVALLTYNSDVTTEIRFSDALRKPALLQEIRNLQPKQTSKQRSLESAMAFVARNTFKRARGGFLLRKVAVFFSNGQTKASQQLNEAVLKLYDAGVSSVFLTNREDRVLSNALQVNNTAVGQAIVLSTGAAQFNETIRKVLSCHVCLDICEPDRTCGSSIGTPRGDFRLRRSTTTDEDIDLVFLLDSSDSTTAAQFAEIKNFLYYVVRELELSPEPKTSSHHARIAVVQHAPYEYQNNASTSPVQVDVGLTEYGSPLQLHDFILNKMTQLYGARSLSSAIQYTVDHVFGTAPYPREMKVIFLILTGEVKASELKQLYRTVTEAKCKGIFFVVLTVGKKVNVGQLITLASEPQDVFFKKASNPSELLEKNLLRFALQLPGFISSANTYQLSPEIEEQCALFQYERLLRLPQNENYKEIVTAYETTDEIVSSPQTEVEPVPMTTGTPTDPSISSPVPEVPQADLKVLDVTENSARLRWTNTFPQQPHLYDLSVTSLADQVLVVKQNVTGTERVIGGLQSGQQYKVTIIGHHPAHGQVTYHAIFTTSKSQQKPAAVSSINMPMNTEPLNTPEIAGEKNVQVSALEGKSLPGSLVCNLPKEDGTCRDFTLMWYYDPQTKSCTRFWYGGCGGNDNRFKTQKECENTCIPVSMNAGVVSAIGT